MSQFRLSRRNVAARAIGSALLGSGLKLRAVHAVQPSTPAASPASEGEWTFTDDKGVRVTLPRRPERLVIDVNAAAPLWDFGIRPSALFGWNVLADGTLGDAGGRIDPSGIPVVGNVSEPINAEAVAAQEPDVIITLTWTPDNPTEYWSIAEDILPQIQPIAPLIAMSATGLADRDTMRFAELAEALGADLSTPELVDAKAQWDESTRRLEQAIEDKRDLTAAFLSITQDAGIYLASPGDWADLNFFLEKGLNIVKPDVEPGAYWENLSLEQAMKYPSDMIFVSTRPESTHYDELKDLPTYAAHPAVIANQVYPWNQDFVMSFQGMKQANDEVTGPLSDAEKVI